MESVPEYLIVAWFLKGLCLFKEGDVDVAAVVNVQELIALRTPDRQRDS